MLSAAPLHQQRADAGRSGEGDLAHGFVGHQLLADLARHAGDDVDDTRRDAGPLRQYAKRQCRKGREFRWLDDHGTAGRQRRRHLAGDHRNGESSTA